MRRLAMRSLLASVLIAVGGCGGSPGVDVVTPDASDGAVGMPDASDTGMTMPDASDTGMNMPDGADANRDVATDAGGGDATVSHVPAPGTGTADWNGPSGATDNGTPERASPVGIVTSQPGYIGGIAGATSTSAFYVFRTGPTFTDFQVRVGQPIIYAHVHDGEGMLFGALIPPRTTVPTGGDWTLLPDHVYVLEIHLSAGGFF